MNKKDAQATIPTNLQIKCCKKRAYRNLYLSILLECLLEGKTVAIEKRSDKPK